MSSSHSKANFRNLGTINLVLENTLVDTQWRGFPKTNKYFQSAVLTFQKFMEHFILDIIEHAFLMYLVICCSHTTNLDQCYNSKMHFRELWW